jgi:3'-phosphoadenosine 5'-phosphosulfate sulfotransferase (PAPS reductase)/FAD synthetase
MPKKYRYLIDGPIKFSEQCCYYIKHKPVNAFDKKYGLKQYVGTMATDSNDRKEAYLKTGCNTFTVGSEKSQPLSFWTEQDILEYVTRKKIPYCKVYGEIAQEDGKYFTTGVQRTGCMFCMFGVHLERIPNRFQKMQTTHPQLYNYCMKDWDKGGLGLAKVLEYINVPYKDYIPQLKDYEQMVI